MQFRRVRFRPLLRCMSGGKLDDSLQQALHMTVRDPSSRGAVQSLLSKVHEASFDLGRLGRAEGGEDPFGLVEGDMAAVTRGIVGQLSSRHPLLSSVARYYFDVPGKRLRPAVVVLIGRATNTLNNNNNNSNSNVVSNRHLELAQIVEMIHTASLAHDDVLDEAEQRRGAASINAVHGNKIAILCGDFLLARASLQLARLRDHTVTELMSSLIAELVEGELAQLRPSSELTMDYYLRKTYLKTASLLRNASRAAALLSDAAATEAIEAATEYGEALGMAFQITDDMLDFAVTTGKPLYQDLKAGIVTAPVLFGAQRLPELQALVSRGFSQADDVARGVMLLEKTDGMARAAQLAGAYVQRAKDALSKLPPSNARQALETLADKVLTRKS